MGVWGGPGFVVRRRPVRQNPGLCQEPSRVAKKNETADDGGGLRVAAPNGPLPQPTPKAHAANCQIWHSEKGELLGPKVKGRMGYSKANI